MEFVKAVNKLDPDLLCKLLSEEKDIGEKTADLCLFHELIQTLNDNTRLQEDGVRLVYILSTYNIDINHQDENGNTAFHHYLCYSEFLHPDIVEAFLRCNADVSLRNRNGESIQEGLLQKKWPKDIEDICIKYQPGLWNAVEQDDINAVRRLVNQWCKVHIQKEGKSLLQLALDKGTEDIIRIISGIKSSVSMAHGVLAGDINYVKKTLHNKGKVNVNFKNMGDRSATPLYYAACHNNTEMVSLLLSHGARIDLYMMYGEIEIPMLFSIMMEYPDVVVSTIQMLISVKGVPVDKMYYKGRNILFHCVDCDMDPDIVETIIQKSSAEIVTQRVQNNITAKDYAEAENCENVVNIINKYVSIWWYSNSKDAQTHKQILVLHGYDDIPQMLMDCDMNDIDQTQCDDDNIEDYVRQIDDFHEAVEMCDIDKVRKLLYCETCSMLQSCLADSRIQGKGQPALHKAILRKDIETCKVIAEALVYNCKQRLDSVRDQYFRTALHYAHGIVDGKELVETLMDYGCSDFVVDKDGRSPLAFKDRQNLQEMKDLLEYQLIQDFTQCEPDPWSVRLQMPVVGYLMDCAHANHKHLPVKTAEQIAVELNPIGHPLHQTNQLNVKNVDFGHAHLHSSTNHGQACLSDSQPWINSNSETNLNNLMLPGISDSEKETDYSDSDESSEDEHTNSASCCIL